MKRKLTVLVTGSLVLAPVGSGAARAAAHGVQEAFGVNPSTQDPSVKVTLETQPNMETEWVGEPAIHRARAQFGLRSVHYAELYT